MRTIKLPIVVISMIISFLLGYFSLKLRDLILPNTDVFGGEPTASPFLPIVISLSPNRQYRAVVVEDQSGILPFDRTSFIYVQSQLEPKNRRKANIGWFEGRTKPLGSERVVWNSDSSKFMLVGPSAPNRIIANPPDIKLAAAKVSASSLPNGEAVYALYELASDKIYCSAYIHVRHTGCWPIESKDLWKSEKWLNLESGT